MAGTLCDSLPPFLLLVAFSTICSYAYSDVPHSPSAGPPVHHNNKPSPGYNPTLPPLSHGKPSPFPIHKPPQHHMNHMKPPTSPPHPLDFPHPSPLISKPNTPPPLVEKHQPPKPIDDGHHPSPPGKPHYPIKPPPRALSNINAHHPLAVPLHPHVHMIPPAAPHDQYPKPTPYKSRPPPTNQRRPPSPLNPKTPHQKMQIATPFNHNTKEPIHHVSPFAPHLYKSPPPHDRHRGIYTTPPPAPIQH